MAKPANQSIHKPSTNNSRPKGRFFIGVNMDDYIFWSYIIVTAIAYIANCLGRLSMIKFEEDEFFMRVKVWILITRGSGKDVF